MKKVTNGGNQMVVPQEQLALPWSLPAFIQVRLDCLVSVFPTSLKNTKHNDMTGAGPIYPAGCHPNFSFMGFFFFTREIGDAQVLVPKPEKVWVPQIKQGVLAQSRRGLWGSTSSLVLSHPHSAPSPPYPLSLPT